MPFDLDTYNQTKNLSGGPIITVKIDDPVPYIEPATDEHGNMTRAGMIAYLIAYGIGAAALAYWFMI
ncbi:MAG: hypothetical protein CL949_00590 [Erythrobacter sp.]|nr:hypothetical protein [Erythrobacter sp.]|tara:strand:- start:214 stop:414 length:201 start_codon:yes stop_codon:yes gene_type:complete